MTEPVIHAIETHGVVTPESKWWAVCGAFENGDGGLGIPALVTCAACLEETQRRKAVKAIKDLAPPPTELDAAVAGNTTFTQKDIDFWRSLHRGGA